MAPCKFFLQGRCTKGETCSFQHLRSDIRQTKDSGVARNTQPLAALHGERPMFEPTHIALPIRSPSTTLCHFFQSGTCTKGVLCTFSHDIKPWAPREQTQPVSVDAGRANTADFRSTVDCKFHFRGRCSQGASCPYSHGNEGNRESAVTGVNTGKENEDNVDFLRQLGGTLTHFKDGGLVSNIQFPWELCGVRIKGLPANASQDSVSALVHRTGHEPATRPIRLWKSGEGDLRDAHINLESHASAEDLCRELEIVNLRGVRVAPVLPSTAGSKRLTCRKLAISWHSPAKLVWLNFGLERYARRASHGFNTGDFKILGQSIEASEPRYSNNTRGRWRRDTQGFVAGTNRVPWTIVLKSVPAQVTERSILDALPVHIRPRHVEMSNTEDVTDQATVEALVRSYLEHIGPVNLEVMPEFAGKRTKAKAMFESETDARIAFDGLKDNPPDALRDVSLIVQLIATARFKIPRPTHGMVKQDLEAVRLSATSSHIKIREFPDAAADRFITLKVEGDKLGEVKDIAEHVDKLVAGDVVLVGGLPFWTPSLILPATQQRLRELEERYGVLVIRDCQKRELRVVGTSGRRPEIQTAVVADLEKHAVEMQVIPLTSEHFSWACRGGFSLIVATIGKGVASFDVASSPKRIIITGTSNDYQQALSLVQHSAQNKAPEVAVDTDCAICYTPAESPVTTACAHRYCLDCFENMCQSAAQSVKETGIVCQGEMGTCRVVLPLQMLQDSLSSAALEQCLESSFNAYVQHRPADFRYCPTPDCGSVYRASSVAKSHACTGCFAIVCVACHNQHATMTCADYKELVSGGYAAFEKLKKELLIKDCPKCSTPIEKMYGCNHMTCGGCGVHICWVCMKTFVSGDQPIYSHMRQAHGSIGLDYM